MKGWKRIAALLCLAMLLALTGCSSGDYKKAVSLTESGDWQAAREIFTALGDYRDSAEKVVLCDYGIARGEMAAGNYDDAIAIFERLGNYEDAASLLDESLYKKAEQLFEAAEWDAAAEIFRNLGDYKQSPDRLLECRTQKALELYEEGSYAEALEIFLELPENADIAFRVGTIYANGYGVEQDLGKAVEWFEKAAARDHAEAQFILGKYCYDGSVGKQDYAKAFEWYEKAAELGYAPAQCELAWMYLEGRYPDPAEAGDEDLDGLSAEEFNSTEWYARNEADVKAFEWFEKAAEQGYAEAQYLTGTLYSGGGRGVKGNAEKAIEWFEKAAEQGYVHAQYSLGNRLQRSDFEKAIEWYEKAAEQGSAFAQLDLGLIYLNGDGTDPDYVKAAMWLFRAARHTPDDYISRYLSAQFERDVLVERGRDYINLAARSASEALFNLSDHTEMFEAYLRGAEAGDAKAQYNVGVCYSNGYGVEPDPAKAVEWYKKSAGQNYVYAQYNLGSCYFTGTGVEQNYEKGFELMKKAAEQGLANAQIVVARCYLLGEGVRQNSAKSDEWIARAMEQGMDLDDIIAMFSS